MAQILTQPTTETGLLVAFPLMTGARWRWVSSIAVRLNLAAACVLIAAVGVFGTVVVGRLSEANTQRIEAATRLPGTLLRQGLLTYAVMGDRHLLTDLVGEAKVDGLLVGATGRVFQSTDDRYLGVSVDHLPIIDRAWLREDLDGPQTYRFSWQDRYYMAGVTPIQVGVGRPALFSVVITDMTAIATEQRWLTYAIVINLFVALVMMSSVTFGLFRGLVTRRLASMLDVTRSFAGGDLQVRLPARRNDELSDFEASLNAFFDQVQRRETSMSAALHEKRFLLTAIEASAVGVFVTSVDAEEPDLLYANQAFAALTGITVGTADGAKRRAVRSLLGNCAAGERVISAMRDRQPLTVEMESPDGSASWLAVTLAPVPAADGTDPVAFIGTVQDISASRRHGERVRQAQKMESVSQLAGGIAHELNNLLQPILSLSGLALRRLDNPVKAAECLRLIQDSARKARDVIRNILLFARGSEAPVEPVDLAEATADALALARHGMPATIWINATLATPPMVVAINRTEFTQVILNLIGNARDAMNDEGTVEVDLATLWIDDAGAERLGLLPGRFARLSVSDHGCGVSTQVRDRIFEPFLTTKDFGRGTGLSLAMCHGILKLWNGAIALDSGDGRGARFELYIPLAFGPEARPERIETAAHEPSA